MDLSFLTEHADDGNAPDFHEFRSLGLGGSDAPILMGESKWCDEWELWAKKVEFKEVKAHPYESNFATERGNRLEPIARAKYESLRGIQVPVERLIHPKYDYVRANYDGINFDERIIVEIKAPGFKDMELAREGLVPPKYFPQVQWLMLVTGKKKWVVDYVTYTDGESFTDKPNGPEEIYITRVEPDYDYMKSMLDKARRFWRSVLKGRKKYLKPKL